MAQFRLPDGFIEENILLLVRTAHHPYRTKIFISGRNPCFCCYRFFLLTPSQFTPPKRRFWKNEQKMKSASKTLRERFGCLLVLEERRDLRARFDDFREFLGGGAVRTRHALVALVARALHVGLIQAIF